MVVARKSRSLGLMEPIPSVEAALQAAKQIREAIVTGAFKAGERLIERELTEQLQISRHPVREALRLLAREGFVDLHRNRGATVSAVEASSVNEVYAIRMALGRLVLDRIMVAEGGITPTDLRQVKAQVDAAMRHAKNGHHDGAIEADLAFQQAIVDASGLQRVSKYFTELNEEVRRFDKLLGIFYPHQEAYVMKYVVSLYEAIREGNCNLAQTIWEQKFRDAAESYLAALSKSDTEVARRSAS